MNQRVYLDHNATSPLRPEARRALLQVLESGAANASSLHAEGRLARAALERAREQVAALVGVAPDRVVFTSGGTEAIATAIRGVSETAPDSRRRILVSAVEHSAVLEAASAVGRLGFRVERVGCGPDGRVPAEAFAERLDEDVALVALQWANNETGVLQPIEEVAECCRSWGAMFFVDAVQAAGKVALFPRRFEPDLVAVSGHKIGGPQGTGALVLREGLVLAPLVPGGAQERRRRGGTEAVASLAGFGAAAEAALAQLEAEAGRLARLRERLERGVRALAPEVRIHGEAAPRLPNTVNFSVPGIEGETLAVALDLEGFAVSTGSACSSGSVRPSHVLAAMGASEDEARGAVRISLGWCTVEEDVDRFLVALGRILERARSVAGSALG